MKYWQLCMWNDEIVRSFLSFHTFVLSVSVLFYYALCTVYFTVNVHTLYTIFSVFVTCFAFFLLCDVVCFSVFAIRHSQYKKKAVVSNQYSYIWSRTLTDRKKQQQQHIYNMHCKLNYLFSYWTLPILVSNGYLSTERSALRVQYNIVFVFL